jgi:rod shape determining protein RodA
MNLTTAALWRRVRTHWDWPLLLCMLAICVLGLANLYSATANAPQQGLFRAQVTWMCIGLGFFFLMALVDYHTWQRLAWWLLIIGLAMIIYVHFRGLTVKGSRRWLGIAGVGIQPSEFIKLAVILSIARLTQDRDELSPLGYAWRLAGLGLAVLLVAWQPDLGTASLVALILVSCLLLTARRVWPIFAGIGALGACIPLLWTRMEPYQRLRVLTFLDPASDPTGAGWHARQSITAIGSGRFTGKGYMDGTQNQLQFLPEHWSDFPFSVWAEEWGFLGSILLLGLYVFLIMWTMHVASQARDRFGATICAGVAAMIFWHVLVNIGMVTGLAPVVGVTLPLVSHGGSSVLTIMMGLGLVASVSMRRFSR